MAANGNKTVRSGPINVFMEQLQRVFNGGGMSDSGGRQAIWQTIEAGDQGSPD
jgi:hypothetical protein